MNYFEMSKEELDAQLEKFKNEYAEYKKMNLNLDMSRGKPGDEQLDLSEGLFTAVLDGKDCKALNGVDCRNDP